MEPLEGQFQKLSVDSLQGVHQEILIRAIANVLSSPIAEVTFAQIFDGLILSDVAMDTFKGCVCSEHPLLDEHKALCPGVFDKARELHQSFDPGILAIESKVSNALA